MKAACKHQENDSEKAELLQQRIVQMEARIAELERIEKEYQQSLQRLAVQYAVTRLLAEANSFDKVCEKILQAICENFNFALGLFWSYERESNLLLCTRGWHLPSQELLEFNQISRQHIFLSGVGLPGRLLATGKPDWIIDVVKDANFPRAMAAEKTGLQSAFGFPILIGYEVFGVMEFFTHACQPPDTALLDLMANIGNQIGEFSWHNWHGNTSSSAYFC